MSTNISTSWCQLNCELFRLIIDNWTHVEEIFRQYSTPTHATLISVKHDDMFQVSITSVLEGSRILKFTAIKICEKLMHMFGAHPFLKESVPKQLFDALDENTKRVREFRFLKRNGPSFQDDTLDTGESSSAQSNNIFFNESGLQNGNHAQGEAPVNDNVNVVVDGQDELEDVKDFGELIRKQKELENQAKLNAQQSNSVQDQPETDTVPIVESSSNNGKPKIAEEVDSGVGSSSSNGIKPYGNIDTVSTMNSTSQDTNKSVKVHDFAAEQINQLCAEEPEEDSANLSDDETYHPKNKHKKKKKRHSRKRKRQEYYDDETDDEDEDDEDYSEERKDEQKQLVKPGPTPAKKVQSHLIMILGRSYEQPKQRYSEGRPPSLAVTRNPYNTVRFDNRLVEEPDDEESEEAFGDQQNEEEKKEDETVFENNVVEDKETNKDPEPLEVEKDHKKTNYPEKSNDEPVASTSRAYEEEPVDVTIDGNQNKKLKKYKGMLFDPEALDILYPEKDDDFHDLTAQLYDEDEIARLDEEYARHQPTVAPVLDNQPSTLMGETLQQLLDMNGLKNIDFGLTGSKMKLRSVYELNNQVMLHYLKPKTTIEWLTFYRVDKNSHFPDAALYITKEMMTDSYEKIYGSYYNELFEEYVDNTDAELLFKYILIRQVYVSNLRFPNGPIPEFDKFNYGMLRDSGSTFVFPGGDRIAVKQSTRYASNSFMKQQNWKNFKIGSMVWVRFKSKWWPAFVVAFESNNGAFGLPILPKPKHGPVLVKNELLIHVKYPDGNCSYMNIGNVDHFTTNFCIRFDPTNGSGNYVSSVVYCIKQLRQVGYFEEHINYKVGNALLNNGWDFNYLPPYQHKRIFCQNTVQGLPDPMILMEVRTKYNQSLEEKSTARVKDMLYSPFSYTEKSIKKSETGRREMAAAHNIDLHHFNRYLEANGGTLNAAPIMYRVTGCVAKVMDKYKPWGYDKNEDLETSAKKTKKEE